MAKKARLNAWATNWQPGRNLFRRLLNAVFDGLLLFGAAFFTEGIHTAPKFNCIDESCTFH
jgi:hypothetical protein